MMRFSDRAEAGKQLAKKLSSYRSDPHAIVLGLARGGVVVAYEIAQALDLPLNVLVPRKIGAPHNPELAIGAIAEEGVVWLNHILIHQLGVTDSFLHEASRQAIELANKRLSLYRQVAPLGSLKGKTVILIDDGIATGATLFAEIKSLRKKEVAAIVVASPVAGADAWKAIEALSNAAICLDVEENFGGISEFYDHFGQVEDEEVLSLLQKRNR